MKVFILFWQEPYQGQQILGVYATQEEAEAARDERDEGEFIREMELGKTYEFGEISYWSVHPQQSDRAETRLT